MFLLFYQGLSVLMVISPLLVLAVSYLAVIDRANPVLLVQLPLNVGQVGAPPVAGLQVNIQALSSGRLSVTLP
jgi:hypothetical protein